MGVATPSPQVTSEPQRVGVRPVALPRTAAPSRRFPVFAVVLPLALIVVAAGAVGVLAFLNSPQQVAQRLADAFSRGDAEAIKKLVVAKDRGRPALKTLVPGRGVPTRVVGVEKSGEQLIAKLEFDLSKQEGFNPQVAAAFGIPSKIQLPFVLVKENFIFWRVDMEKSEPLIAESFIKSLGPQFKQFMQAMMEAFVKAFGQALQQMPKR